MTLTEGYHDFEVEYFQAAGPYGYVLFGWDPAGGTAYDFIPLSNMVQADETSGPGRDDLVISASGQTMVFSGRSRENWLLQTDPVTHVFTGSASYTFGGAGAAAAAGDFNRDGRDDFAVADSSHVLDLLRQRRPGRPHARQARSSAASAATCSVYDAGDVDADGTTDLLVTGSGSGYVIFGDSELSGIGQPVRSPVACAQRRPSTCPRAASVPSATSTATARPTWAAALMVASNRLDRAEHRGAPGDGGVLRRAGGRRRDAACARAARQCRRA